MRNKKKATAPAPVTLKAEEPTLHMRLLEAKTASTQATNIFMVAAENLERASEELDTVAAAAEAEADELLSLVEQALAHAEQNRIKAAKIRSTVEAN